LSGYRAFAFYHACDGIGKCVVLVKAENGRIEAGYNENSFSSVFRSRSPNLNGFIASVDGGGRCGEIFHRNQDADAGVDNYAYEGPVFGTGGSEEDPDLLIKDRYKVSCCVLGGSYGGDSICVVRAKVFRAVDYEVFKIVIE
jgi:hypothetical protein